MPSSPIRRLASILLAGAALAAAPVAQAQAQAQDDVAARAAATEAQMTDAERVTLTLGLLTSAMPGRPAPPPEARPGAGYIHGVPRLGIPALYEVDASLGVAWSNGTRGSGGTQLPSGTAQAATFDPALIEAGGRMIGAEARAKGFNVMLAGGVNLMRDPRNGRTFEYLSEDPLLAGVLGGAAIRGIQSNQIISTIKHFAINPQETGRAFMNAVISDDAARESDLLAFQIAIEQGNPGSVMCAYNALNGPLSCGSKYLLTDVLRRDWGYQGFVMSDWGAVDALDFALAGLDQQSGSGIDPQPFFGEPLKAAAASDPAYRQRLGEMTRAILRGIYAHGLDRNPAQMGTVADPPANAAVARKVAQQGIVLLTNRDAMLPLGPQAGRIAVIGGMADTGTVVGGGSSRVLGDQGPAAVIPYLRDRNGPFSFMTDQHLNRSVPLAAISAAAPGAKVTYRDGRYPAEAAQAAAQADVVILFANQYMSEGFDVPDLSLPDGQDALIEAVAAANPNVVVVLQTGGPVTMPWKDKVRAVVEAWYPGAMGAEAIADVLFGAVNPSGRLPVSFPASEAQLPRPALDGAGTVEPNFVGTGAPGQTMEVNYNIEGSDIGYRWYARQGIRPLFPFGHGLSYTTFAQEGLTVARKGDRLVARVTVRNTGSRAGAEVAQVYLAQTPDGRTGQTTRRLAGFARVELAPGEVRRVDVPLETRVLAEWSTDQAGRGGWDLAGGTYRFVLAPDALGAGPVAAIRLPKRRIPE